MQKAIRQAVNVLLVLATILVIIPERAFATGDALEGGDEESDITLMSGTHYIRTVEDLVNIQNDLSGTYYLQNDLDLSGFGNWIPLCSTDAFAGHFDGKGHLISGLTMKGKVCYNNGLFSMNSGFIENLKVDVSFSTDDARLGALVGENTGIIKNCFASGSINGNGSSHPIGGLVGFNPGGEISMCGSSASVVGTGYGGVGGLVGQSRGSNASVINCYSTGSVTSTAFSPIGGLMGYNYQGPLVKNCYSLSTVSPKGQGGGLIGGNSGTVISSYYNTTTSGNHDTGRGTPKTSEEMKSKNTYVEWDFDTVWGISSTQNNGYPYLRSMSSLSRVTVTFSANSGVGSMEAMTCTKGNSVRLPASTFYRAGYTFTGWNTRADGSGTAYRNQAQITPTDNITLYAQWLGEVTFEQELYEVEERETITITATIPDVKSAGGFVWTPSNETISIISGSNNSAISNDGICTASIQVRGDVAGLCTLTLTLPDGRSGSCQIRITQPKYSLPLYQDGDAYKFTFRSNLTDDSGEDLELEYTYHYDETWFFKESTFYQHDLVKMSIRGAMAAYGADGQESSAKNIVNLMKRMQFKSIESNYPRPSVSSVYTENNTIGYAIGSKNITDDSGNQFALIIVAVRGGGYYDEWGDNFNIGTGVEHAGFAGAASKVLKGIENYLTKHGSHLDENRKIWIMGYSRAAATTNIVAKNLDDGRIAGITPDNVYAFCFECPQTTRSVDWASSRYNNIISIVNPIDFVPKLAMSEWGYHRYGRTYFTPDYSSLASRKYKILENRMATRYKSLVNRDIVSVVPGKSLIPGKSLLPNANPQTDFQSSKLEDTMRDIASWLQSPEEYVSSGQQKKMIETFKNTLGYSSKSISLSKKIFDGLSTICNGNILDESTIVFKATGKLALVVDDLFKHPVYTSFQIADVVNDFFDIAHAHFQELCFSWVDSLEGELQYISPEKRVIFVNCPVDVQIYDSTGTLVGKIESNIIADIDGGVCSYIDANGQKVITLPVGEEYQINMTATDSGTVTYSATCYNMESGNTEQVVSYHDIPIVMGDTLTAVAENLDNVVETEEAVYSLEKDGVLLEPDVSANGEDVKTYAIDIRSDGNGMAIGGGTFVMGEYAQATAEPEDGEVFNGWYNNSTLVSTKNPYRFLVDKNLVLTAKFSSYKKVTSIEDVSITNQSVRTTVICPYRQATVYCAVYQSNGQLVSVDASQVTDDSNYIFMFTGCQFDYAKIFVLDENRRSLCVSKSSGNLIP